jgi:hypothetical protein
MPARDEAALPAYPTTPPGRPRFDDPSTVSAGLRYWRAALARALPGSGARVVAAAMVDAYRAARESIAAGR